MGAGGGDKPGCLAPVAQSGGDMGFCDAGAGEGPPDQRALPDLQHLPAQPHLSLAPGKSGPQR